jgi:hypothetical protein
VRFLAWLPVLTLLLSSCQPPPAHLEDRDLFLISKNGKYGFIDRNGQIRIKPQFYSLDSFHEGLARAKILDGGWGFIDKIEAVVISFQFDEAENFSGGLARVKRAGKWITIDKKGALQPDRAPKPTASPSPAATSLSAAKEGNKWGYRGAAGQWVIQPQYDWAGNFENGLARVEMGLDQAYIDMDGKIIWRYAK